MGWKIKPGDLVVIVKNPDEETPEDLVGQFGLVVREVTVDDGHPINSWCDWWVLIRGEMIPLQSIELRVVKTEEA